MALEPLFASVKELQSYLLAAAFVLARMTGFMLLMPLFSRVPLPGLLRNGVALALAGPVFPMIVSTLTNADIATSMLAVYILKEAVCGVTLALALARPLSAPEPSSYTLDLQRGS